MTRKKSDRLIGILSLADIIVLIVSSTIMSSTHSSLTGSEKIAIYSFDTLVVALIAISFSRRMNESQLRRKYLKQNWYELVGMVPIVVFGLFGQSTNTYVESITLGTLLRLLVIIYFIKPFIEAKFLRERVLLHIFIIFFLTLVVSSYLFYFAERSAPNSKITNLSDALWWTIQTASTATFGPNAITAGGRIVGAIIMLVGIGITSTFISTLAAELTRLRIKGAPTENDPKLILKIRLAKGEITKESYSELLKLVSE